MLFRSPLHVLAQVLLLSGGQDRQHHAARHAQHHAFALGRGDLQSNRVAVELARIEDHRFYRYLVGFAIRLNATADPVTKTGNAGSNASQALQLEGLGDVLRCAQCRLTRTLIERDVVLAEKAGTRNADAAASYGDHM